MLKPSFSSEELRAANPVELPTPNKLTASDGVALSYRRYLPATAPCAAVLFYHGGGAHSGAGYQHLGNGLQTQFSTVVYMPDIRGHGNSGSPRGDTSTVRQVWADITTFIKHIRAEHPQLPIFLGGHSSGAGLVLNYTSQSNRESVDYYIFLSPEFGYRSKTARPSLPTPFAKVNIPAFIINAISGGLVLGHFHAVRLNYPTELLASDKGLVTSYSVNMANALTPSSPQQQFTDLDCAFGLWIGEDDEILLSSKVLEFADLIIPIQNASKTGSIASAKHLSILINAHEAIGFWIASLVEGKNV